MVKGVIIMKGYEDWVYPELRSCDVILTCTKEFISEDEVKFINIEEDMQGRDTLTFECPKCKEEHKSLRFN